MNKLLFILGIIVIVIGAFLMKEATSQINPETDIYAYKLTFNKVVDVDSVQSIIILQDTTRLRFKWGMLNYTTPFDEQPVPFIYPDSVVLSTDEIYIYNSEVVYDSLAVANKIVNFLTEGYYAIHLSASIIYSSEGIDVIKWSQKTEPIFIKVETQNPPYVPVFFQLININ